MIFKKKSTRKMFMVIAVAIGLFAAMNISYWLVASAGSSSGDIDYYGNSEVDFKGNKLPSYTQVAFYGDQLEDVHFNKSSRFIDCGDGDEPLGDYNYQKAIAGVGSRGPQLAGNYVFTSPKHTDFKYEFYNLRFAIGDYVGPYILGGERVSPKHANGIICAYQTATPSDDSEGENFIFTFGINYTTAAGEQKYVEMTDQFTDTRDSDHRKDTSMLFDNNELTPIVQETGCTTISEALKEGKFSIVLLQLICDRTKENHNTNFYGNSKVDFQGNPLTASQVAFYGDELEEITIDKNSYIKDWGPDYDFGEDIYVHSIWDRCNGGYTQKYRGNYDFSANDKLYQFCNLKFGYGDKLARRQNHDYYYNGLLLEYQTWTPGSDENGKKFIFTFDVHYVDQDGVEHEELLTDSFTDNYDSKHALDSFRLFTEGEPHEHLLDIIHGIGYDNISDPIQDGKLSFKLVQLICDRTE